MRRVGCKHCEPALNHPVLVGMVSTPIHGHLGHHVLARFSVVLEVDKPRRRVRIDLDMLRSLAIYIYCNDDTGVSGGVCQYSLGFVRIRVGFD
jgi:hypothetical protein